MGCGCKKRGSAKPANTNSNNTGTSKPSTTKK